MNNFQLSRAPFVTSSMPRARACALIVALFSTIASAESPPRETFLGYDIVATYAHDEHAFTQGLALLNGEIVESRGMFGASAVTIGEIQSGVARRRHDVARQYFAEGLAVGGGRIVQLTWRSGVAFVYDTKLKPLGELHYEGEGWGLTFDGTQWLMSDGSDRIVARKLDDFSVARELHVTDRGVPVRQLNELEYARGRLYANIWHSDRIAVIDPSSGLVEAWLDLSALRGGFMKPPAWDENEHVLNGIAYNPRSGHFYVTGKCWPVLFEIALKGG